MHVVGRICMFVPDGQLAPNQVVIDGVYRHSQTLASHITKVTAQVGIEHTCGQHTR